MNTTRLGRLIRGFTLLVGGWLLLTYILSLTGYEFSPNRRPISESREGIVSQDPPIRGTLWSERYHYKQGEPVHLRFTLQNISFTEVVLENDDQPVVDILLVDQQVRWSEGAGSDRDLSRLVLGPRESYVIDWYLPPFPDGRYSVYGLWESVNGEVRLSFCYGITSCPRRPRSSIQ